MPIRRPSPREVNVLVCTYNRNTQLQRLLMALADQDLDGYSVRATVVDNSTNGIAEPIATNAPLPCRYRHHPHAGIASVRNTCLDELTGEELAFAFIDDDEVPNPRWLSGLIRTAEFSSSGVSGGPVEPLYDANVGTWYRRLGFFVRSFPPDGDILTNPSTNNSLVLTRSYEKAGRPRFRSAFDVSGGEDTDFFLRLCSVVGPARSSVGAKVFEDVPVERARISWLWRRGLQLGAVNARTRWAGVPRPILITAGLLRAIGGLALAFPFAAVGAWIQCGRMLMWVPKGMGLTTAALGHWLSPYSKRGAAGD